MSVSSPSLPLLNTAETIARSDICRLALTGLTTLQTLACEGLAYFASNERQRRTFFKLRETYAAPHRMQTHAVNPKPDEWDYLYVAVSPLEWVRRNPYHADKQPMGEDFSYTENPAKDRVAVEQQRLACLEAVVDKVWCEPPGIVWQRRVSEVAVNELRGRRGVQRDAAVAWGTLIESVAPPPPGVHPSWSLLLK